MEVTGMSVAGGDLNLPKGHKFFVNLRLDYSKVELDEAIQLASEGSSVRVKAQAKLRTMEAKLREQKAVVAESASNIDVNKLPWFEFDVSVDFESERGGPRDPQKVAASAFSKMTRQQKVETVASTLKISIEEADKLVPADETEEEETE